MSTSAALDLKYPIGKFQYMPKGDSHEMNIWLEEIKYLPQNLRLAVSDLDKAQLAWRYRPEGWMIKQVVHHCADSHMNCLVRFKLSLTEDAPVIKPYYEERWAELPLSKSDELGNSLHMLDGLHYQMHAIMSRLDEEQLARVYVHPEHGRRFSLREAIALYAWHGKHHHAHILQALASGGKWK